MKSTFKATLIILLVFLSSCSNSNYIKKIDMGNNIENFLFKDDGYYIIYPRDPRYYNSKTLICKLDEKGNVDKKYTVSDENFSRGRPFQNPLEASQIILRPFGENSLSTDFYTFNLDTLSFEKNSFDYFKYEVGLNSLFSYGKDHLISTVVSHKTGDQNTRENGDFQMSISNTHSKKSVETPFDATIGSQIILDFNGKAIYGIAPGLVESKDTYEGKGMAVVDFETEKVSYLQPDTDQTTTYSPIFSTDDKAYILSDNKNLYEYDNKFNVKSYPVFAQWEYPMFDETVPLQYSEQNLLLTFNDDNERIILADLDLKNKKASQIDLDEKYVHYRLISQNYNKSEIYLTASTEKEVSDLIILDRQSLTVKKKFPIKNEWEIDLVVHK